MFEAQNGRCAGCGNEMTIEEACVDHDGRIVGYAKLSHAEKRKGVFALLHRECNSAAGLAKHDPEILHRLAEYVQVTRHNATRGRLHKDFSQRDGD